MRFTIILIIFLSGMLNAQDSIQVINLPEYLGYVKSFHPIVKQANLIVNESEAKLLKARGAFDPKIEVDYDRKKFKNTEYFDKLNAAFKIPTWYGVEFKGNFEENEGFYLNPEANVPQDGLYSVGVSVSVARGLLANKRMAMLKQAKNFVNQSIADQQIQVNNILYEATIAYFNWLKTYNDKRVYENFLKNADIRFQGIKQSFNVGDKPAIDTVEARITLNDRKLNLEKSRVKFIKASLELSNFLWLNENTPIEIKDNVIPDVNTIEIVDNTLNTSDLDIESLDIDSHPKMRSLNFKLENIKIDRRLKLNNLLPQIDLQYNFLSQTPDVVSSFSPSAYKGGINFYMPLFLRKERGDLKLANLKLQNINFDIASTRVNLRNKIDGINQELESYVSQNSFLDQIVSDYVTLLSAEERKFFLGESSLFLVNSRESKLIDAKLKAIKLENDFFKTKAKLFNTLATADVNSN